MGYNPEWLDLNSKCESIGPAAFEPSQSNTAFFTLSIVIGCSSS